MLAAAPIAAEAVTLTIQVQGVFGGQGTVSDNTTNSCVEYGDPFYTECQFEYPLDTIVALSAEPGEDSAFDGWGVGCSGTGICQVTMSADQTVTAQFHGLVAVILTVQGTGGALGSVTASSPTEAPEICDLSGANPNQCFVVWPGGTAVTLTATPATGSVFAGFSGSCSGTAPCSFSLAGDTPVGATFVPLALSVLDAEVEEGDSGTKTLTFTVVLSGTP